ncbi:hypothetical protein ACFOZY_11130 [Chungangia koreensis]|uniref:YphF n=1 Tax=Chungangia koreensis TaxID=752657 RepID=A0ABV8X4W6_9LACT
MANKLKFFISLSVMLTILSGCMYPNEQKAENQIPYEDQLNTVQSAVNRYQEATGGLLPIKTRDMETDQFIKYPIEFSKIVPAYTEKIPSNAFENGGIYQYVLMDVEENPTVKLVDLRTAEKIRELNIRKGVNGFAPISDVIVDNVYKLNYEMMGYKKEQTVPSPYSNVELPLVITGDGTIYVDYSIELNRILTEDKPNVKTGEDIRYLLTEKYPVVPAYSLPYTVNEKNEPIFLTEKK